MIDAMNPGGILGLTAAAQPPAAPPPAPPAPVKQTKG
jgi:hypothetical protein